MTKCELCGEPMPAGEEMFKYHGYSGDCPKPPMPRDDCDVTGQPGPLPETGWDEVPADALNRTLTQRPAAQAEREALRIAQADSVMPLIGPLLDAWENADREVMSQEPELSKQLKAIDRAMEDASLPAPQQATPATHEDIKVYDGIAAGYFADTQQATPEPVPAEQAKWCEYVAGMVDCWVSAEWSNYHHKDEDRRIKAIAGIIERRLWALKTQPATPEPVGEALQGGLDNDALLNAWRSKLPGVTPTDAQMTAFALGVEVGFAHARTLERSDWSRVHEALQAAGVHPGRTDDHLADVIAKALATRPAPGVPEGFALVPVEPTAEMMEAMPSLPAIGAPGDMELKAKGWSLKAIQNRHRWLAALAAAQAKGGEQ